MNQIDERDTLFARLALKPDSEQFNEYYNRNPHLLEIDRQLRKENSITDFSGNLNPDSAEYLIFSSINKTTMMIRDYMAIDARTERSEKQLKMAPEKFSLHLHELLKFWGASHSGITEVSEREFYSTSRHGKELKKHLKNTIVFAVEMNRECINRAPYAEAMLATLEGYAEAARIGCKLSMHLKSLGFNTALNTVFDYQAPLVWLAATAGIGEIGRNTLLVTPDTGSRIRLGAVMTDAELKFDGPIEFGLKAFCNICGRCAENCPTRAVDRDFFSNAETLHDHQWQHDPVKCYQMWLKAKTDCGICISSCPFSQGVNAETLEAMKNKPEQLKNYLEKLIQHSGKRNFTGKTLPILSGTSRP
ncbi:MAG: reductive dehalogenase domain-containing protein [Candidatus Riflebacteria bacterium]